MLGITGGAMLRRVVVHKQLFKDDRRTDRQRMARSAPRMFELLDSMCADLKRFQDGSVARYRKSVGSPLLDDGHHLCGEQLQAAFGIRIGHAAVAEMQQQAVVRPPLF